MREIFRRGLLLLALIAVLGGVGCSSIQARGQESVLEAYLDSPIPEDKYDLLEEVIAAEITEALAAEGIIATPPVVFEFDPFLRYRVVSPRERIMLISRREYFMELSPTEIEELERHDSPWCTAAVGRIGGRASTPPRVSPFDSRSVIRIVAHEWGHKYFEQYPLDRVLDLVERVNEVIAEEITAIIFQKYGWEVPSGLDRYVEEVREVRIVVEQLLSEGRVEEAEAYMEEERLRLCAQDFCAIFCCPRKLNQAYLASTALYESNDQLFEEVRALRAHYPDLKSFLEEIREVSSYEDFLSLLEEKGINYPEG